MHSKYITNLTDVFTTKSWRTVMTYGLLQLRLENIRVIRYVLRTSASPTFTCDYCKLTMQASARHVLTVVSSIVLSRLLVLFWHRFRIFRCAIDYAAFSWANATGSGLPRLGGSLVVLHQKIQYAYWLYCCSSWSIVIGKTLAKLRKSLFLFPSSFIFH